MVICEQIRLTRYMPIPDTISPCSGDGEQRVRGQQEAKGQEPKGDSGIQGRTGMQRMGAVWKLRAWASLFPAVPGNSSLAAVQGSPCFLV